MIVEVCQSELDRFRADFGLTQELTINVCPAKNDKTYGTVYPPDRIDLFLGLGVHGSALRFVTHKVNETMLHELRHLWQWANWSREEWNEKEGAYWSGSKKEMDAREFAAANIKTYRLVRVKRPVARSGLSRLSAAQERVRTGR